jgi:hypothetical protein
LTTLLYRKQVVGFVGTLQNQQLALHDALKTQLFREILRMQLNERRELDRRQREALSSVKRLQRSDEVFKLAIHVRRTDKVTGEAVQIGCEVFANAVETLLTNKLRVFDKFKSVLIHLMSDDPKVMTEWSEVTGGMGFFQSKKNAIQVNFRAALNRPDRTSDLQRVEDGFYDLLIDLRLMVEAHAFLGSQSS